MNNVLYKNEREDQQGAEIFPLNLVVRLDAEPDKRSLTQIYPVYTSPTASSGEGELHKKRTDRGKVSGSGIKTRQPICDGWLRQSWAFFTQVMLGGKGAFAQNSPTIIRL